jgi:hypothetical protein
MPGRRTFPPKTLALARLRAAQLQWALAATSLRWGDDARAEAHARRAEGHAAEVTRMASAASPRLRRAQ